MLMTEAERHEFQLYRLASGFSDTSIPGAAEIQKILREAAAFIRENCS